MELKETSAMTIVIFLTIDCSKSQHVNLASSNFKATHFTNYELNVSTIHLSSWYECFFVPRSFMKVRIMKSCDTEISTMRLE